MGGLIAVVVTAAVFPVPAVANGRQATPAARNASRAAVRILAPKSGGVVNTPTVVAVKLRIWTRHLVSLQMTLNDKPVPISKKSVHILREGNAFIWTGKLNKVRLSTGANRLTVSIRGRNGVQRRATVTFRGPELLGRTGLDVTGTTVTDGSVELSNAHFVDNGSHCCDGWEPLSFALTVPPGSRDAWHVRGAAPDFYIEYQILKPDGSPSGYWIYAYFQDPLVGGNSATCAVTDTDSTLPKPHTAIAAPYSCLWSNPHGYNPSPILTIQAATIIQNEKTAETTAYNACKGASPHCVFGNVVFSTGRGKTVLVTQCYDKSATDELPCSYGTGKEISESDSISISLAVAVTLAKIVQITVTTTYQKTWTTTYTYTSSATLNLKPGEAGWFTLAPLLQTASGAFFISNAQAGYDGHNYLSQGAKASFTVPEADDPSIVGDTCKIKPGTDPNDLNNCEPNTVTSTPVTGVAIPGPR